MAINRVETNDFLVFKGEFATDFCPGVNVLIGGNGTGKTTLLKQMYMACEFSKKIQFQKAPVQDEIVKGKAKLSDIPDSMLLVHIDSYFQHIKGENGMHGGNSIVGENKGVYLRWTSDNLTLYHTIDTEDNVKRTEVFGIADRTDSIFIPANEMLSHSKGFLSMYHDREMPFDKTYADILSKAGLPITRNVTPIASRVIDTIKNVIRGEVVYENDIFYVLKEDGRKTPFSLEASGYRRFGLLWRLLRNGLLETGTILFWDEPENSLSPDLFSVLVDILLDLSRNGVQIFIATHSEILASYFAVNREKGDIVMFTSLYKEGEQIKANTSDRFDLLEPNKLTAEVVNLYEKEIVKGLGGNV